MVTHKKQAIIKIICLLAFFLTAVGHTAPSNKNSSPNYQKFYFSYFSNDKIKIVSRFTLKGIVVAKSENKIFFLNPLNGLITNTTSLDFVPTHILIDENYIFVYKIDDFQRVKIDALSSLGKKIWNSSITTIAGDKDQLRLNVISKGKLSIKTYFKTKKRGFYYQADFNRITGLFTGGDRFIDGVLLKREFISRMYYEGEESMMYWTTENKKLSGSFNLDDIIGVDKNGQPCSLGFPKKVHLEETQISILFDTLCVDDNDSSSIWIEKPIE